MNGECSMLSPPTFSPSLLAVTGGTNLRNMESLLLAAQQQQLRQLRRLKQLKRQAELAAAMEAAWEEKQMRSEEKRRMKEQEVLMTQAQRAAHAADVNLRRQAAAEAALDKQEVIRRQWQVKLDEAESKHAETMRRQQLLSEFGRIAGAKKHLRQQQAHKKNEQELKARRQALLDKEVQAEKQVQAHKEMQALQQSIRMEQESLRQMARRDAQLRAEQEEEAKRAYYAIKHAEREKLLSERTFQKEQRHMQRSADARNRFTHITQRAQEAAQQDVEFRCSRIESDVSLLGEFSRAQLSERLQTKMARAEDMFEQRAILADEVQRIKRNMAQQEQRMKDLIEKMQHTGKWKFPPDVLQNLATLESTITSPYASPRSMSPVSMSPRATLMTGGLSPRGDPGSDAEVAAAALRSTVRPGSPGGSVSVSVTGGVRAALMSASNAEAARQEAALQKVLEEEIMREMQREALLRSVGSNEERKKLLRAFAVERETAKERILAVGSKVVENSQHSPPQALEQADASAGPAADEDAA